jgi:glycosyltransferase involved in cell wall biosynthesis
MVNIKKNPLEANKLRVLVVPPSYIEGNRTIGGGERYALEYSRALSQLAFVTLGLLGDSERTEKDGHLEIRVFKNAGYSSAWPFALLSPNAKQFLEYDLIHVMVFPTPLTDFLILLSLIYGIKVVLTDVGGGGPCLSTRISRLWKRLDLNRFVSGMAHLSHYASMPYRTFPCKHTVLHGGVRHEDLLNRPVSFCGGYALFVGRLLPHKGVLELVRCLSADTPLRVVGRIYDQEYFNEIKRAAGGKLITFHTNAGDFELAEHYRGANVVVQPSLPSSDFGFDKSELLGLVALEGMSWAKPVVVTAVASLPETSIDGITGNIIKPYNYELLRLTIEKYVKNPELSFSIGKSAKEYVFQKFIWKQAAYKGMELYMQLMSDVCNNDN